MVSLKSVGQIGRTRGFVFVLLTALAWSTIGSAQTLITLASFGGGSNGANPYFGNLVADANGNLFGSTIDPGYGTVFEIAKTTSGYSSTPTILLSFDGINGGYPVGSLTADANGNLFGTTNQGGAFRTGTVFEIAKTAGGYASTPTILASFDYYHDGGYLFSGLITDTNGNFFGTTSSGGPYGIGTVFEIVKTPSGYVSTPTTVAAFTGNDGSSPYDALIADSNGNLLGTTQQGGASGAGNVFEVVKTTSGYSSTPISVASFNLSFPYSSLTADANGNLFGTTYAGGTSGLGTVFEIVKTPSGYASTPTTLVSFNGNNGSTVYAGLIIDGNGNLFGTTYAGGANGHGTVFEVAKTSGGYANTPTILVNFDYANGANPYAGLIADANGNLFGTTFFGGAYEYGAVFEITGSGFVPPRQFAGTPGSTNCTGKSISNLTQTYGGLAHAASALGYASVNALQTTVAGYCGN
jgi:uncharacterized repeat protein (TIGR03803 family)